jgi:hypothetical protein
MQTFVATSRELWLQHLLQFEDNNCNTFSEFLYMLINISRFSMPNQEYYRFVQIPTILKLAIPKIYWKKRHK